MPSSTANIATPRMSPVVLFIPSAFSKKLDIQFDIAFSAQLPKKIQAKQSICIGSLFSAFTFNSMSSISASSVSSRDSPYMALKSFMSLGPNRSA